MNRLTASETYFLCTLNPKTTIMYKHRAAYLSPASSVAVGAKYNDMDEVKLKIKSADDIEARNDIDAIFFAAKNGNVVMCKFLIENGYTVSPHAYNAAAAGGNINVLDFFYNLENSKITEYLEKREVLLNNLSSRIEAYDKEIKEKQKELINIKKKRCRNYSKIKDCKKRKVKKQSLIKKKKELIQINTDSLLKLSASRDSLFKEYDDQVNISIQDKIKLPFDTHCYIFGLLANRCYFDLDNHKNIGLWQDNSLIVLNWLKNRNARCNPDICMKYAFLIENIKAMEWLQENYASLDLKYVKRYINSDTSLTAICSKSWTWLKTNYPDIFL